MKRQPALYKSAFCADYEQQIDWSEFKRAYIGSINASKRSANASITITSTKESAERRAALLKNSVMDRWAK